jgi:hypothetical protein
VCTSFLCLPLFFTCPSCAFYHSIAAAFSFVVSALRWLRRCRLACLGGWVAESGARVAGRSRRVGAPSVFGSLLYPLRTPPSQAHPSQHGIASSCDGMQHPSLPYHVFLFCVDDILTLSGLARQAFSAQSRSVPVGPAAGAGAPAAYGPVQRQGGP